LIFIPTSFYVGRCQVGGRQIGNASMPYGTLPSFENTVP
jgi:hypothetical protein